MEISDNEPFDDEAAEYEDAEGAPRYPIPSRQFGAVEVPALVQNIDRAIQAFGRVPDLNHALDPERQSIPLYLNPESPFFRPIFSHNATTHNVVLKITAPKRTGRKRKRGSHGPWQGDEGVGDGPNGTNVSSFSRRDDPKMLRRQLADNAERYRVDAVGIVKHTHRFRALADFYWNLGDKSDFANRYVDNVLPGDMDRMKGFNFSEGIDRGPGIDIMPPPVFTHQSLPFNYFYQQNPYVRMTEEGEAVNSTAVKHVGHFIAADDPAPTAPNHAPDMTNARVVQAMAELEEAFEERPIWTRRSLMNYLVQKGGRIRDWNELKVHLSYAAYQFKGGPWRDSVVPYGIDPRVDPKYRIYQTLMFKLVNNSWKTAANADMDVWYSIHGDRDDPDNTFEPDWTNSHLFDGETYHLDGKVWQICDIVDPLLKKLVGEASLRPERHPLSGWYHGGTWAQLKAIMKTKLLAIRFGRVLYDHDFAQTLMTGDKTPTRTGLPGQLKSTIPLPNLGLTHDERVQLNGPRRAKRSRMAINRNMAPLKEPHHEHEHEQERQQEPEQDEDPLIDPQLRASKDVGYPERPEAGEGEDEEMDEDDEDEDDENDDDDDDDDEGGSTGGSGNGDDEDGEDEDEDDELSDF